jgi:RNA polymerase sigma-70 factor, ECF subfamily
LTKPFSLSDVQITDIAVRRIKIRYLEEKLLIQNLKDPEKRNRAFEQLVVEYQRPLYWQVRRLIFDHEEANDVLQNAFIKAWKNIEQFRAESSLKTWLYRIAINEALSWLSQKKKRQIVDIDSLEDSMFLSEGASSSITSEEIEAKFARALETLPEKQKIVFQMKYFEEMKYEEIVAILGGTVGSLKASFHHAVKKIEDFLTRD